MVRKERAPCPPRCESMSVVGPVNKPGIKLFHPQHQLTTHPLIHTHYQALRMVIRAIVLTAKREE